MPPSEFQTSVKKLKRSSASEICRWILRCLRRGEVRLNAQSRIVVTTIVLTCLCERSEQSLRALDEDQLPTEPRNPSDSPTSASMIVSDEIDIMAEIWCTIKSTDFRSLPAKVCNQFLQDLQRLEEARENLNIPLASPLPAFPSARLVLAEAGASRLEYQREFVHLRRCLRLLPQHQHLLSPAEAAETLHPQEIELSGKAFIAATGGRLSVVRVLDRAGDKSPAKAWQEACALGQDEFVESMFRQHGFDVNARDERAETPILKACRAGAYGVAMFLLRNGATAATEDGEEDSPLHWLSSFEDAQIPVVAEALVKAGARMDCQSTAKSWEWESEEMESFASGTPLHRAVCRNRPVAVACLLRMNASPSLASKYELYHTPVSLACALDLSSPLTNENATPMSSVLSFLLNNFPGYKQNQTHSRAQRRLPTYLLLNSQLQLEQLHGEHRVADSLSGTLDILISRGERLSDPDHGYSLLHLAIKAGRDDLVSLLLQKYQKFDVNLTFKAGDMFWHPPLYYAVRNGRRTCFKLLLQNGSDPFQRFRTDYFGGGSRLAMEFTEFSEEAAEATFDRKRIRGPRSTYLHTCAGNGSGPYFISKLLAQGLRVNAYDSNWESPLFLAILACDFESADLLISHGAATEVLSDDRTMLGHMAEDGFMAPYAAYDYILKAQARCGPRGAAGFMAIYKEYRTWLHVLVQFWGSLRNPSWGEALLDLFVGHLPTTDLLNVQCDGTADTALSIAVKDINLFAVRRLLDWGADPNVPNYSDGYPRDIVLTLVHRRITEHSLTLKMVKSKELQSPKIRQALDEVAQLEEIFTLLGDYGAKQGRETPPRGKKLFEMPDIEEEMLRGRHKRLRIDLSSINDDGDTTDGAIDEICKDIASEFLSSLKGKTISAAQGIETFKKVFASHLCRAPEAAYSRRRLFRVKQYLGSLVSQLGCSLHLEFDLERYGWRIELQELPAAFEGIGISILAPPKAGSSEVPLVPLRPEHQFGLATRRADLNKLDGDDRLSEPVPMGGDVPISQWQQQRLRKPTQRTVERRLDKAIDHSPGTSQRANMGALELIRFEQLLPPPYCKVVVGPDDELASLFFKDNPLPAGYRVVIIGLRSGSHFSLTVAANGEPPRTPFLRAVPNGHYFTDADEARWYRDQPPVGLRGEPTDWSRYGGSRPSEKQDLVDSIKQPSSLTSPQGLPRTTESRPSVPAGGGARGPSSSSSTTSPGTTIMSDRFGGPAKAGGTRAGAERATAASSSSTSSAGGGEDDPELLAMLRDIPLVIIINKDDGPGGGRQINSSMANQFASMLAAANRATVVAAGREDDEETVRRMTQLALDREEKDREEIQTRGVPEGMHWWEVRKEGRPGGGGRGGR